MSKEQPTFFFKVYNIVRQVPRGRVTTYGAVANYLELGSARMVGWAMNKSFSSEKPVPAHRVVNREGRLTGKNHFAHPNMMQELLENEGIVIVKDKVQNFAKVFWNPSQEL